jgi:hypothetical protein
MVVFLETMVLFLETMVAFLETMVVFLQTMVALLEATVVLLETTVLSRGLQNLIVWYVLSSAALETMIVVFENFDLPFSSDRG